MTNDRPQYGVQYALTGTKDTPSIMNGNTWAESRVQKQDEFQDQPATLGKNAYGREVTTIKGGRLYTTMKRHNGFVATSVSRITRQTADMLVSEPLADMTIWCEERPASLTNAFLLTAHKAHVERFLTTYVSPDDLPF